MYFDARLIALTFRDLRTHLSGNGLRRRLRHRCVRVLFHQMNQLGLVGDAGHFKDPTPGQGISDAFRQADQLLRPLRMDWAPPVLTRQCSGGGVGETTTRTKCTGLLKIWARQASHRR